MKVIDVVDILEYHELGASVFVWCDGKVLGPVKSVFRLTPGLLEDLGMDNPTQGDHVGPSPVIISTEHVPHVETPWRGRTSLIS